MAAEAPDFHIAAIGRSGSTMLANWLTSPPGRIVFNEPFFLRPANSRLLRIQLANLGMPVSDAEWAQRDETPMERFRRLMSPRLSGRRWATKEVLCEEYRAMVRDFSPPRVLLSVRDLVDVALSFFEKHRLQDNLDRFSDGWVSEYCLRESDGLVGFMDEMEATGTPCHVVRYEDFVASADERSRIAEFTGWPGHGDPSANLADFDRSFEVERHGSSVSAAAARRADRNLDRDRVIEASSIAERCARYQRRFGYA